MQWDKLFHTSVFIDDVLYCHTEHEHLFMTIDINTGICKFLSPRNYNANEWQYTEDMIAVGNDIYLLEQNGHRLLKYSLENNTCITWKVDNEKYEYVNSVGLYHYHNKLYIICSWDNKIITFDLKTSNINIEKFKVDKKYIYKHNIDNTKYARKYSASCLIENTIYIFSGDNGYVVCKNLDTEKIYTLNLPKQIKGCTSVVWNKNQFFILSKDNQLFTWDGKEKCELIWKSNNKEILHYKIFIITEQNIWILPALGTDIIIIDKATRIAKVFNNYPKDYKYIDKSTTVAKYYNAIEYKDGYYVAATVGTHMLYIDKVISDEKWVFLNYENSEKINFMKNNGLRNYTELFFSLEAFLEGIQQNDNQNIMQECRIGRKIWRETNECMQNGFR